MKRTFLVLGLGWCMFSLFSCAKKEKFKTTDALSYHLYIEQQCLRAAEGINQLGGILNLDSVDSKMVARQFSNTKKAINTAYEKISEMQPFQDSIYYKNAAARLLSFYRTEMSSNINDLVEIKKKETLNIDDKARLQWIRKVFPVIDSTANANFFAAQSRFIKKHSLIFNKQFSNGMD